MVLRRVVRGDAEGQHVFQCAACKLTYMTEDHVPISGILPSAHDSIDTLPLTVPPAASTP